MGFYTYYRNQLRGSQGKNKKGKQEKDILISHIICVIDSVLFHTNHKSNKKLGSISVPYHVNSLR